MPGPWVGLGALLAVLAAPAAPAAEEAPPAGVVTAAPAASGADALAPLVSLYQPNYLIAGPEDSPVVGDLTTKFQLSLKFDVGAHWYLAYTQRLYWDVTRHSQPIVDLSLQPELFYVWRLAPNVAERLDLQTTQLGLEHESNGKDGAASRSWNRAYVEPHFRWGGWFLEPRVWAILSEDEQNPDIADYYGYFDLRLGYEGADGQRFTFTGRHGSAHGSAQLDMALPMRALFAGNGMRPWLYAQAWAGYGETLLYYNVYTRAFRIGIEFHP